MTSLDVVKRLPGRALWHTPHPFGAAAMLRRGYSLRCVLFHDVAERTSSFTDGLDVTLTPRAFERTLRFLVRHYTPVSLEEALNPERLDARRRPVLVTFDDAYASIVRYAIPICQEYGVPTAFFVSAKFLDNRELALDNLVCHVVHTRGFAPIDRASAEVTGAAPNIRSFRQIFGHLLPSLSLRTRQNFQTALARAADVDPAAMARDAGLYLTSAQLAQLGTACELGNHTYSHVHLRALQTTELPDEIDRNREIVESITGRRVRCFSVPYGSSADLPPHVADYLDEHGYDAVFLVGRLMNTHGASSRRLYRVSIGHGTADADLFSELELLPRLRAVRADLFGAPAAARP